MIVIVAGSRTITDYALVKSAIEDSGFKITTQVSGHAQPRKQEDWQPSVDLLGERWAKENGLNPKLFIAPWTRYGKSAGMIRNGWMAEYAATCSEGGALVALIENSSSGSVNMVEQADKRRLSLFVRRYETGVGLVKETRIERTRRTDVDLVSSVGWLDLGK